MWLQQRVKVQYLIWMFSVEFLNLFQPVIELSKLVWSGYSAQLFLSQTGVENLWKKDKREKQC